MEIVKVATAAMIKEYFGVPTLSEFKEEWDQLSEAEKAWYKAEYAKVYLSK